MTSWVGRHACVLGLGVLGWWRKPPHGFRDRDYIQWRAIVIVFTLAIIGEATVTHILLANSYPVIASIVAVLTILWLLGDYQAIRLRPHQLVDGQLHLACGLRAEVDLAVTEISSIRELDEPLPEGALRIGLMNQANIVISLDREVRGRTLFGSGLYTTIGIAVQNPAKLVDAVRASKPT